MKDEINYIVIEVAKSGIQRQEFFNWSIEQKLYKVDFKTSFNSRMKAVYQGKCPTEDLTAVIAIHNNKPIAMCLCENMDEKHKLYRTNADAKIPVNADIHTVGFLSFFVKERYRKKGIAHNLMALMETARLPIFLSQTSEDRHPMMVFEAREKAIDIIKKSKHSYAINCDRHHSSFREKLSILAKHADAILNNKIDSMFYSNPLMHIKKEKPVIELFEKNNLKKVKIKELLSLAPLNNISMQPTEKVVKKLPTLKPRNNV